MPRFAYAAIDATGASVEGVTKADTIGDARAALLDLNLYPVKISEKRGALDFELTKEKVKKKEFDIGDLVLKWDVPKQDRGKHKKFDALWIGPFKISEVFLNNTYRLQDLEGEEVFNDPLNEHFLNKCFV